MWLALLSVVWTNSGHLLLQKHLKHICSSYIDFEFDTGSCSIKSITNLFSFEDALIKGPCKYQHCFIKHLSLLLNTNNVLSASILENPADKLGLARGNEYQLEIDAELPNQLLELFAWDELALSQLGLKEQKIAVVLRLRVILVNAVAWNVQHSWLALKHIHEVLLACHSTHKLYSHLRFDRCLLNVRTFVHVWQLRNLVEIIFCYQQ